MPDHGIVVRAVGLAVVLAAAAVPGALLDPPAAGAREEFAKAQKKDCRYCHESEKGGGPRNDNGRLFEANGFTFDREAWSGDEAKAAYRRALAAYRATHYREVRRLLTALRATETYPGGRELLTALETRLKPFAPAWLRAARRNLAGTSSQRAAGMRYLVQVVRECPGTPEAREADALLADLRKSKDRKVIDALAAAEAGETVRLAFLDARLLEETGEKGAKEAYERLVKEHPAAPEAKYAQERLDLLKSAR